MLHRHHADGDRERFDEHPDVQLEDQLVDEQRNAQVARHVAARRFGGIDVPASLGGALAAIGVTVLLGSIAASITSLGYAADAANGRSDLTVASIIAAAVTVLVAFAIGGWVAGRMARYDGGRTALLTAGWFVVALLVAAVVGALSDSGYDVLRTMQAPAWLADNVWTLGGVAVMVGAVILMLIGAFAGGLIGERYHRRIDELVASTGARRALGSRDVVSTRGADPVDEPIDLREQSLETTAAGRPPAAAPADLAPTAPAQLREPVPTQRATDDRLVEAAPTAEQTLRRRSGEAEGQRHARLGAERPNPFVAEGDDLGDRVAEGDDLGEPVAEGDDLGAVAGSPARRDDRGVAGQGVADWSTPRRAPDGWRPR